MSHEERQVWVDKARTADQEHKKKWPTFVFQPRRRPKGNVPASRKVTESDRSNVTPKVNRRTKNVPVEAVVEPQEMMYVELESPGKYLVSRDVRRLDLFRQCRRCSSIPLPLSRPLPHHAERAPQLLAHYPS